MADNTYGEAQAAGPAAAGTAPGRLSEPECWELIGPDGIGRIGFSSPYGPLILPVNFKVLNQTIVFRTDEHGPLGEDLRTGIADAEYKVAFEIDAYDMAARAGWSVLIQGNAHHVDSAAELETVRQTGVTPWAPGQRELYLRIIPIRVTGRRVSPGQPDGSARDQPDGPA